MNKTSRTITGTIGIILGMVLTVIGFFVYFTLIYGIPILIVSVYILFNKEEDEIEQIRDKREGGRK